jgi:Leucine-rich repeat (LRR) protein
MLSRTFPLVVSLLILAGLPESSAGQAKADPKNPKVDPKKTKVEPKNPRRWDLETFIKEVSVLPAEEQVSAVLRKMKEVNPGFREFTSSMIVDGAVAKLWVNTYEVEDIAPVRAFEKLVELYATGPSGSKLIDVSPLAGLKLSVLDLSYNAGLSEISVIRGMPLKTFRCLATAVATLAPLENCQTLEDLECGYSHVTSLKPLKGLKLKTLGCSICKGENGQTITDLSPLQGMMLTKFHCDSAGAKDYAVLKPMPITDISLSNTPIADFTVLKNLPLKTVALHQTQLTDAGAANLKGKAITSLTVSLTNIQSLNFVREMPLEHLDCHACLQLRDLAPLKGIKLKTLHVAGTQIRDLTPLTGAPLTTLYCANTNVFKLDALKGAPLTYLDCGWRDRQGVSALADLTPLAGSPLQTLYCDSTMVKDLKPLSGTPISILHCQNTVVKDLTPLAGTPIVILLCKNTKVVDFSPLKDAEKLSTLDCDCKLPRDTPVLKQIKTLRILNGSNAQNVLN